MFIDYFSWVYYFSWAFLFLHPIFHESSNVYSLILMSLLKFTCYFSWVFFKCSLIISHKFFYVYHFLWVFICLFIISHESSYVSWDQLECSFFFRIFCRYVAFFRILLRVHEALLAWWITCHRTDISIRPNQRWWITFSASGNHLQR